MDESLSTPAKNRTTVSQIKNKADKIKAYQDLKRNIKFDERPPFIPYVPIGRWVEKDEDVKLKSKLATPAPFKTFVATTKKTTSKKQPSTPGIMKTTVAAKKRILTEINSDPIDLNSTFEIISSDTDNENKVTTKKASSLKSKIVTETKKVPTVKKEVDKKVKKNPITRQKMKVDNSKSAPVQKALVKKTVAAKIVKPVVRKQQPTVKSAEVQIVPSLPVVTQDPPQKEKEFSRVYRLNKINADNQASTIKAKMEEIKENMDTFMPLLSEDAQTQIHQIIHYGNRIINEKLKNFLDLLLKYENDNTMKLTENDIEDYWDSLYDEIEKFKEDLFLVSEMKQKALKEENDGEKKKRRTTRLGNDLTPSRRSRRIAEQIETPK